MGYGILKFDTLTTSDSVNTSTDKSIDTSYIFNGITKSWQDSDEGTTINDSFNQSTLTDNGTGDYTNSFTNNMGNAYYVPAQHGNPHTRTANSYTQITGTSLRNATDGSRTTSSYNIEHGKIYTGSSGAKTDGENASHIIGDLA